MIKQRNDIGGPEQGACLASETLAAYLDHRLTDAERADVERHVASCDDCRELLVEAFRAGAALDAEGVAAVGDAPGDAASDPMAFAPRNGVRRDIAPAMDARGTAAARGPAPGSRVAGAEAAASPEWRRRVWMAGGGLLAAAAALILIVRLDPAWYRALRGEAPDVAPLHAELVKAVGGNRYVEPRLTGFAYGPVPPVTRSVAQARRLPPDVRIAIATIEQAAQTDRSPALTHALGVAKLVAGDVDGAIGALDALARAERVRPRVLSDLSAAYLARARDRGDPADISRALDAAQRAVTADASLPEAWFNLALARDAAGERDRARDAWTRYLTVDQASPWRAEAEQHLASPSP